MAHVEYGACFLLFRGMLEVARGSVGPPLGANEHQRITARAATYGVPCAQAATIPSRPMCCSPESSRESG